MPETTDTTAATEKPLPDLSTVDKLIDFMKKQIGSEEFGTERGFRLALGAFVHYLRSRETMVDDLMVELAKKQDLLVKALLDLKKGAPATTGTAAPATSGFVAPILDDSDEPVVQRNSVVAKVVPNSAGPGSVVSPPTVAPNNGAKS